MWRAEYVKYGTLLHSEGIVASPCARQYDPDTCWVAAGTVNSYLQLVPPPNTHEKFMRAALAQAKKGLGKTSPNPAVGAILVNSNRIIARGYHRQAGGDHAEVDCL